MSESSGASKATGSPRRNRRWLLIGAFLLAGALITAGILALLVNIFEKKQEAAHPYFPVVNLDERSYDPAVWGQNFPLQYDSYKRTSEQEPGTFDPVNDPRGTVAKSKLQEDPRLVTMWQGYAFSIEYNTPRGHDYMLVDQRYVKRVTQFNQPGTCLNCHGSMPKIWDELGNGDRTAGYHAMNKMTYNDATKLVDHPVGCIDCHDPATMALRITRPAFVEGIKELKASQGIKDYDVTRDATANEMRAYVCAQCHVEYYFKGPENTLTFPWEKGLTVENAYDYYNDVKHVDFNHKLTGANALKAQHPDFETWSQGVHARAGVTCSDCHMPYQREGAVKVSNHQVRSPMTNNDTINAACLTCHHESEEEMKGRVEQIHDRYKATKDSSFDALDQLIKGIEKAKADGTANDRLEAARAYQRRAQFFLDYVVSENSEGFHAPQYTMTILQDVTNSSRLGQLALLGQLPEGEKPPQYDAPTPTPAPAAPAPSGSPAPTMPPSPSASPTRG